MTLTGKKWHLKVKTKNMKKIQTLVGLLSFFFIMSGTGSVEAKTAQENYVIYFNQGYGPVAGPCSVYDSTNDQGPNELNATITYNILAYNVSNNSLINENDTVPTGTQIRFESNLNNNSDIFWFLTGTSWDTPNGIWTDSNPPYPFQYSGACTNSGNSGTGQELFITRPSVTFDHNGSTATYSCNANGSVCTVSSAGTLATSLTIPNIRMGFGGNGVSTYPGYPAPSDATFNNIPTLTYPVNVSAPSNLAPNAPTINGPENSMISNGVPATESFIFQATDSNNDQIRYGIDWDNNSTVDQWLPALGFVNSGVNRSTNHTWNTAGTYVFQALAQDSNGANSGWTQHTILVGEISNLPPQDPCEPNLDGTNPCFTIDLKINNSDGPLEVPLNSNLNISWTFPGPYAGDFACNAFGSGWSSGGSVPANGTTSVTASQGDTYIIHCTDGYNVTSDSVEATLSNSLKMCQSSCSSGVMRGVSGNPGSFTLAQGGSQNLVACFNPAASCSDSSGNVSSSANWNEGGGDTISLSGSDPRTVNGDDIGVENVSAEYNGQTAVSEVTVTCLPTVSCVNAPGRENYCQNETFAVSNGCGVDITCNGIKTCDYNWKEVAP